MTMPKHKKHYPLCLACLNQDKKVVIIKNLQLCPVHEREQLEATREQITNRIKQLKKELADEQKTSL
jgi:hypothetical protein